MADSALFVGWGNAVRGRERQALKVFGDAIEFYGRLQQEGEIEAVEPVFLEPHGGDLGGFFLLRGDVDRLAALRVDDDFTHLMLRASLCVDNVGVVGADLAERLQRNMEYYTEQIAALA